MSYKLGIDVGSTTVKTVVLNEANQIVEKSYQRHYSKVREVTYQHLKSIEELLKDKELQVVITGSAGMGMAKAGSIPFAQEVFATAEAIKRTYPQTDVAIELGGEDAKILFLQGTLEERMNGTCAGGTGSFIDQMATLLGVSLDELNDMSLNYQKVYPIASRCGVFAKTDIQALLNQGANKEDIAASVFQSVVEQTITGLAQGREIKGNVLFLGGPLSFLKGLQNRFKETLGLSDDQAIFPKLAPYYVALGASFMAEEQEEIFNYQELMNRLENAQEENTKMETGIPLFKDESDYQTFVERHSQVKVKNNDIAHYQGKAYLGIDAGSTTTKVILLDESYNILYSYYKNNEGNPVSLIQEQLKIIRELCGDKIEIVSSAATGYGEDLMQAAFGIDNGVVETIAHYTAAKYFYPEVDFIIDIGGQDIKCFTIVDNTVDSVTLNEACSSGCGSFISTFASSLEYTVQDFAKIALFAKNPVDLGSRCTVFMNSSVKQAQKDGATVGDISAGLAISVIKNALYKVMRVHSAADVGKHVVVQGGTFLNEAVLRAFEQELGVNVVRPQISELMGAFGAALYAAQHINESSTLIEAAELDSFEHKSISTNCRLCTNNCAITVNTFQNGQRFVSGNKCERGAGIKKIAHLPNLVTYKYNYLNSIELPKGPRLKVGIPLVLNMYDNLPYWIAFFAELNCSVTLSDQSSRKLYMQGIHTIPSDTACYPAKLVHGHIDSLQRQDLDMIFYPSMTYAQNEGISDNSFNCPVVAYYPELIKGNIEGVADKLFGHHIKIDNDKFYHQRLFELLSSYLPDLTVDEIQQAVSKANEALADYRQDVVEEGKQALSFAKTNDKKTIVLASRPYHIDPEINHGIDLLLTTLGFVVVTEDAIPYDIYQKDRNVLNQWSYHARMYQAADYICDKDNIEMIQLVSFGCGIDAVTSDEVSAILRSNNKLYTQLKIDENSNLGAAKIRVRSLLAAMKDRVNVSE